MGEIKINGIFSTAKSIFEAICKIYKVFKEFKKWKDFTSEMQIGILNLFEEFQKNEQYFAVDNISENDFLDKIIDLNINSGHIIRIEDMEKLANENSIEITDKKICFSFISQLCTLCDECQKKYLIESRDSYLILKELEKITPSANGINNNRILDLFKELLHKGEYKKYLLIYDNCIKNNPIYAAIANEIEASLFFYTDLTEFKKKSKYFQNCEDIQKQTFICCETELSNINLKVTKEEENLFGKTVLIKYEETLQLFLDDKEVTIPNDSILWEKWFYENALSSNIMNNYIAKFIFENKEIKQDYLYNILYNLIPLSINNSEELNKEAIAFFIHELNNIKVLDYRYKDVIYSSLLRSSFDNNTEYIVRLLKLLNEECSEKLYYKKYNYLNMIFNDLKKVDFQEIYTLSEELHEYSLIIAYLMEKRKSGEDINGLLEKYENIIYKDSIILFLKYDMISSVDERKELLDYVKKYYLEDPIFICLYNMVNFELDRETYTKANVDIEKFVSIYQYNIYIKMLHDTQEYSEILSMYDSMPGLPSILKLCIADYLANVPEDSIYWEKASEIYLGIKMDLFSNQSLVNYFHVEKKLCNYLTAIRIMEKLIERTKNPGFYFELLDLRVSRNHFQMDQYVLEAREIDNGAILNLTGYICEQNKKFDEAFFDLKKSLLLTESLDLTRNYFRCCMSSNLKYNEKKCIEADTAIFLKNDTRTMIICCYEEKLQRYAEKSRFSNAINTVINSEFMIQNDLLFKSVGQEVTIDEEKYMIENIIDINAYIQQLAIENMCANKLAQVFTVSEKTILDDFKAALKKVTPVDNYFISKEFEKMKYYLPFSYVQNMKGKDFFSFFEFVCSSSYAPMPVFASDFHQRN